MYFYSPLDEMHLTATPPCTINKFTGTHLYTWVERGTVRVKFLVQKHNTMILAPNARDQAWVVWKVDNTINQINRYPVDSMHCFVTTYPVDSDLSSGYRYPAFNTGASSCLWQPLFFPSWTIPKCLWMNKQPTNRLTNCSFAIIIFYLESRWESLCSSPETHENRFHSQFLRLGVWCISTLFWAERWTVRVKCLAQEHNTMILTRDPFLEGPETFFHPKSRSKISKLMTTELFYAQILNMNRGSLHTRSFRHTDPSVFKYQLTKNGFVGLKSFRGFPETGPRVWSLITWYRVQDTNH